MPCQSTPSISQKRVSDYSYFHCGSLESIASHSKAQDNHMRVIHSLPQGDITHLVQSAVHVVKSSLSSWCSGQAQTASTPSLRGFSKHRWEQFLFSHGFPGTETVER